MISIGAHWAFLQSAAWVGMAVAYTVDRGSLVEGLNDTFSGERPCPLCKAVASGLAAEQDPEKAPAPPTKLKELTLGLVAVPQFVFPPAPPVAWSMISKTALRLAERPPTPPPQAAC
jgi:hypothetical protein